MRRGLVLGLVAVIATAGGAVATPGTPAPDGAPFVDAGLDQEVYVGDQVYLDGGGTWDDQGDITITEWEIETPNGSVIQPDCPDCWFTHFFVNQTGQYNATLIVRDAEGHVNSDTLYVTVQALEADMLPEPPNASGGTSGGNWGPSGGGGGDEDCWVAHSANRSREGQDSVDDAICDDHGMLLGYEDANFGGVSEGNHRRFLVFEDEGLADDYSEWYFKDDGTVAVPVNVFGSELEDLADRAGNNGAPGVDRDGNNNNNNGGGGSGGTTGGNNRPTGGDAIGMGPTHGSCNAPCGANS